MVKERVGIAKVVGTPFGIQAVGEIITKCMHPTTRTHACFQDGHVVAGIHEFKSGSQSGDSRSNDYHFLGLTNGGNPFRAPGKEWGKSESCPRPDGLFQEGPARNTVRHLPPVSLIRSVRVKGFTSKTFRELPNGSRRLPGWANRYDTHQSPLQYEGW